MPLSDFPGHLSHGRDPPTVRHRFPGQFRLGMDSPRPESTEIGDALAQVVRGKELQSLLAGTPLL
jgi:hypothetical protein